MDFASFMKMVSTPEPEPPKEEPPAEPQEENPVDAIWRNATRSK